MKIALAGNPNSGKTTLFNALTGANQHVGNWPGVTVEKKEGKLKGHKDVTIVDLPGIYSLSPYTMEEVVARDFLIKERPEVILNIVDGTNIERNLYLTTQLLEIGIPVVVAINMMDVVNKSGDKINIKELSETLGCEVVEISALKTSGIAEAAEKAVKVGETGVHPVPRHIFSGLVEHILAHIEEAVIHNLPEEQQRWYAIKLFERDKRVVEQLGLAGEKIAHIEEDIKKCEKELDDDSESIITSERYDYIAKVIGKTFKRKHLGNIKLSDKIDRVVTNRILALPIFAAVMFLVYYISISTVGAMMTDWVNEVLFGDIVPTAIEGFLTSVNCVDWLSELILDGIVAGVGAVLGFVPQLLVLFLCLSILEDCGYMSRIAFIMDKIFRRFGLSGKSFIPIMISTGCGIPGIMASRTIESDSDRRITVMTATFIPCGAKLPIIALIAGALFSDSAWVAASAYFLGIAAILVSGIMLKKMKPFLGKPAPFIMELPAYHLPSIKGVLRTTFSRGWAFIKKAFTIILLACTVIWFLGRFNWSMSMVEVEDSMLASIGGVFAFLFSPLGWGDFRLAVASLTGLLAKESIVGTLGVLFGHAEVGESGVEYWEQLRLILSSLAAYSFLVFNLLCAPCAAAIGAVRREMMSGKWTWAAVGYQCGLAYAVSLMIYQLGMLFTGNGFNLGTAFAFVVLALFVFLLVRKPSRAAGGKNLL